MACLIVFAVGAALVIGISIVVVLLGFQLFTTYPLRWGWRQHSQAIGKQVPNGDPRLDRRPRRNGITVRSVLA